MLSLALSLSLAIIEVTAHGAVADDDTSDSAAFRAAFAAAGDGDTVHAGCGVWDLPKIDSLSAVYIYNRIGITFDGDGACTSLKMAGGTHVGDYHIFHVKDGSNLTFKEFACDGNRSNIVSADEQTHCFNVDSVDGFTLHDAALDHMYGDGAKFLSSLSPMTNVHIYDVTCDDNGRSGLAFHKGIDVLIERFTSTNISDAGIDTEPPVAHGITNFTVRDSYIGPATTPGVAVLALSKGDNMAVYNTVIHGCVHGVQSEGVILDHVVILAPEGLCDAVSFNSQTGVVMNRVNIEARGARSGIATASTGSAAPNDWTLTHVRITVDSGTAFLLNGGGAGELAFSDVRIRSSHPSRYQGTGIYLNNTLAEYDVDNVTITDVDITGTYRGISVLRGASAGLIQVVADGAISLATAESIGTNCSNITGGSSFDRTGLTVTAITENSGCP